MLHHLMPHSRLTAYRRNREKSGFTPRRNPLFSRIFTIKAITMNHLILPFLLFLACHIHGQSTTPFIHIDQFGYLPEEIKVAVLSDPQVGYNDNESYTPSSTIGIYDAQTNVLIQNLTPMEWNSGATHNQSGDRGWWVDFSSIQNEGIYYLKDEMSGQQSFSFEINRGVFGPIIESATRMLYYNRCGVAKDQIHAGSKWADEASFIHAGQDTQCRYVFDSTNQALVKDLSGGWFDAGDYNKYVTFADGAIHNLLKAYEENPRSFSDHTNIPESGNGVPDILDEIVYELEWMRKMHNDDGSVHIKMGSVRYDHNENAPPSANYDSRFYGPTCSSASLTVAAVFSYASRVLNGIATHQNLADDLLDRAKQSWNHVYPMILAGTLETDCDDGTIKSGDADRNEDDQMSMAMRAAIYLFLATQEQQYHDYIIMNVGQTPPLVSGFWGPYEIALIDALLDYANHPQADMTVSEQIYNSITEAVANNYNAFFGWNENDLYRGYMPDWSYHWGSNQPKASYGILNMLISKNSILPGPIDVYEWKAREMLHYFHGVNPQNMVYLSNMYEVGGDHCANEIYHTWFADGTDWDHALTSTKGPAPGFLVGGANKDYTVNSMSPPYGQPAQKSYLDFNDNWPYNSWEITEPAIYYQAAYVRLLAHFSQEKMTTSSTEKVGNKVTLFPNPARTEMRLMKGKFAEYRIYNAQGQMIKESKIPTSIINIGYLKRGNYWIGGLEQNYGQTIIIPFEKI